VETLGHCLKVFRYNKKVDGVMWKESLCVGVETIDQQHKTLFNKIGELICEVRAAGTLDKQKCISTILFLKEYAISHFADEEAYQQSIGYNGFEAHKKLHERFVQTLLKHEKIMVESDFAANHVRQFVGMLAAWLLYHVSEADQRITHGSKQVMYEEIVFCCVSGVLEKMVGLQAECMKKAEKHNESFAESVAVKVDFTGNASGHITVVYPVSFIKTMMYEMMHFMPDAIDELELSALREVTNIISGSVCGKISNEKGIPCDIKPPAIVSRSTLPSDEKIEIDTGSGIVETVMAITFHDSQE